MRDLSKVFQGMQVGRQGEGAGGGGRQGWHQGMQVGMLGVRQGTGGGQVWEGTGRGAGRADSERWGAMSGYG